MCSVSHESVDSYFLHLKYKHKLSSLNKYFQCTSCPQSFQSIYSFRRHLINSHPSISQFSSTSSAQFSSPCVDNFQSDVHEEIEPNRISMEENEYNELDTEHHSFSLSLKLYGHKSMSRKIANEIILNIEEYNTAFIEHIENSQDLEYIKLKLNEFKGSFKKFNTEYKFQQYLKEKDLYSNSDNYIIDDSIGLDNITGSTRKGVLLPIKDNIRRFLQLPNVLSDMLESMNQLNQESSQIRSIIQGSVWMNKVKLFPNKLVLPYQLYQDDLEINNPLGSKRGLHKVTATYITFPLLKDSLGSKLENILTVGFTKAIDIVHGNCANFMPLINVLKDLEEQGIDITIDSKTFQLHLILSNITGDNLGLNSLLGYTKSFVANHCCRICVCHRDELRLQTEQDESLNRNQQNYTEALDEENVLVRLSTTGIRENCIFHHIQSFNVWDNVTCDILHDIYEGIVHYEVCEILNYMIFTKSYFTLDQLNARKSSFDYGFPDNTNKSVNIQLLNIEKKSLKMSASQIKCFLHFSTLFIGDFVPTTDPVWLFYLKLLRLIDKINSPSFNEADLNILQHDIKVHHETYLQLFPGSHLMPKHHFMLHYASIIRKLGPLKRLWTMRLEAKHKDIKEYAHVSCNRKNIVLSLAIQSNYHFAYQLHMKQSNPEKPYIVYGKGVFLNLIESKLLKIFSNFSLLEKYEIDELKKIFSVSYIEICNTKYQLNNVVSMINSNDELSFNQIKYILQIKNETYLVCMVLDSIEFDNHFDCYRLSTNSMLNNIYTLININSIKCPPLNLIKLPSGDYVIKLKTPFV